MSLQSGISLFLKLSYCAVVLTKLTHDASSFFVFLDITPTKVMGKSSWKLIETGKSKFNNHSIILIWFNEIFLKNCALSFTPGL